MARLMLSAGMLFCLASAMIVRRRGFMSGSPPPARAATVNSLMRRVKILPRLASAAPFLCLIECHLECPDMSKSSRKNARTGVKCYHTRAGRVSVPLQKIASVRDAALGFACEDDPDVRALVPRSPTIIAD